MRLKSRMTELTFETALINIKSLLIYDKEVELDLSSIHWIDPFGIIFMRLWFEKILNQHNKLKVILSDEIVNYLVRMNFPSFFKDISFIKFVPEIRQITQRRRNLRNRLVELTDFIVNNDDEVEAVTNQIIEIVSGRIEQYNKVKNRLYLDLVETFSNVQVHSTKTIASAILQSYGNSIILVVSDSGVGIKTGLKTQANHLNDQDSIEQALKPRVTGRTGDGGMGLTEIVTYVYKNNDKICIRSRSGYYIIENGSHRKGNCMDLPGTQLYLKLQC